jgi:glucosamine-6-phosphate deaminase
MTTPPITVHSTPEALGDALAARLLAACAAARAAGRPFLLGCPTGRTPRPIFAAMAERLAAAPQDLSHVVLVMMDEYLVPRAPGDDALTYASADAPWSCHHFAEVEIAGRLNAALPSAWQVDGAAAWFPDPDDPAAYDWRLADAGGIDLFLLASGASDGHVAFNPPGSPQESRTRIIPLPESMRRDNLQTFPTFGTLDAVPYHGVSVGVATIAESRAAIMVAWGAGKRQTVARMRAATGYEPEWPATLVHLCAGGEIVCDAAAAGEPDPT